MAPVANPMVAASLIVAWLDTQPGKRAGVKRIAQAVGESRRSTVQLLSFLAREGYVKASGDQWTLTVLADQILAPGRGGDDDA